MSYSLLAHKNRACRHWEQQSTLLDTQHPSQLFSHAAISVFSNSKVENGCFYIPNQIFKGRQEGRNQSVTAVNNLWLYVYLHCEWEARKGCLLFLFVQIVLLQPCKYVSQLWYVQNAAHREHLACISEGQVIPFLPQYLVCQYTPSLQPHTIVEKKHFTSRNAEQKFTKATVRLCGLVDITVKQKYLFLAARGQNGQLSWQSV